jgi:Major tropism determinant N-terminal domain
MAVQVQYRYGTTVEHTTFTGVASEITVDTTKKTLVVHDGNQAGGFPLAKEDLSNVPVFVGATSSTAGVAGRIPTPAAGDQVKILFGNGTWGSIPNLVISTVASNSYTLLITDAEKYLRFTNTGVKTLTIPTNANVAFPIGTTISGMSVGTNQLTIAPGSGVTVNTPETLRLRNKTFVSFVLTKVGTDEWDLAGDLEQAA